MEVNNTAAVTAAVAAATKSMLSGIVFNIFVDSLILEREQVNTRALVKELEKSCQCIHP